MPQKALPLEGHSVAHLIALPKRNLGYIKNKHGGKMALNVKYCVSKTCQIVGLDKVILHGGRFAPRTCQWQRKPTKTAPANVNILIIWLCHTMENSCIWANYCSSL